MLAGAVSIDTSGLELGGADIRSRVRAVEAALLGGDASMTRREVAERVGVPLDLAQELWHRLGFAHTSDDDVVFTEADVAALALARDLVMLGILDAGSQAAMVRTWGRSFARLAEWQTNLLATLALSSDDPGSRIVELTEEVLPRLEVLQSYIWRRHLVSAANRLLTPVGPVAETRVGETTAPMAVGFVDIVGYTSRSRTLSESELVDWVERFEDVATTAVVDRGGRVIKTIGDEILYATDDPVQAVEIALTLTERGEDPDDTFPSVRAGVAYGEVVVRLGDVYGSTVNIAARLTSIARPGTVVVDQGMQNVLVSLATPEDEDLDDERDDEAADGAESDWDDVRRLAGELTEEAYHRAREALSLLTGEESPEHLPYRFRRIRRAHVKGYPGLRGRVLRRVDPSR